MFCLWVGFWMSLIFLKMSSIFISVSIFDYFFILSYFFSTKSEGFISTVTFYFVVSSMEDLCPADVAIFYSVFSFSVFSISKCPWCFGEIDFAT